MRGAALQFNPFRFSSTPLAPSFCSSSSRGLKFLHLPNQLHLTRRRKPSAIDTDTTSNEPQCDGEPEGPPSIDFAFVAPRLLPDGMPDVHYRTACGGQKLRDIMLDAYIDLYGPYSKALLNCSGAGTCGTCIVEVVEGKELLSPRTDKEKEKLKKKPKTWRLACQVDVGKPESTGEIIIQQLPEWKNFKWDE